MVHRFSLIGLKDLPKNFYKKTWTTLLLCTSLAQIETHAQTEELVVYSARNEQLIKPLFDAYKKESGVTIKFVTDKEAPLIQKLKSEGASSPADLLITVDAGNLWLAAKEGVLKAVDSPILEQNIPAHLRDPQKKWFGLSVRARTIFYNKDKVKPEELSTYEDLAQEKWKKKLCLRTSDKVYNQSLVAMMISEQGEAKTEATVKGWVNNLATDVFADDTKLLEAIAAGQCQVGIANTYYYGRIVQNDPKFPVGIFWPNQKGSGVHVNISGAGITAHTKKEKAAQAFLEWLSSEKAQNLFADGNLEYPVNPKVKAFSLVDSWGSFKQNLINVSKAGENQGAAVKLMDRAHYK